MAKESQEAGRLNDGAAFGRTDEGFHMMVSEASNNIFLQAALLEIRAHTQQADVLLFHRHIPGSMQLAGTQHMAIAEAIAAGDPEAEFLQAGHGLCLVLGFRIKRTSSRRRRAWL